MKAKSKQNPERNTLFSIDKRITEIELTSLYTALAIEQQDQYLGHSRKSTMRYAQDRIRSAIKSGEDQEQKDAIIAARKALRFI